MNHPGDSCNALWYVGPISAIIAATCGCAPTPPDGGTGPSGDGVVIETVLADLDLAVALAVAPDGRVFFTEKGGRLRVLTSNGLIAEPVLTVAAETLGERGLLGVALHPDFADNQWIYLFYTARAGAGVAEDNRVVRFTLDGNQAAGPETVIATLPVGDVLNVIHNGGNIRFGPDDRLYVTIGDVGDPDSAQQLDALSGRILRYNDDGSIPEDNPLGSDNPTFALGMRNTFDFTFDPITGIIFSTENSTNANDELNRIIAGGNYGWPEVEGIAGGEFVDPILSLGSTSVAPTGIDFAPSAIFGAEAENDLFYGELLTGLVYQVDLSADRTSVATRRVFVEGVPSITDVAFSPDGTLYLLTLTTLYRVAPVSSGL